jgi:hypothetical protein
MLIKKQYAQQVDQMSNPKEKGMVKAFFFAVSLSADVQQIREHKSLGHLRYCL